MLKQIKLSTKAVYFSLFILVICAASVNAQMVTQQWSQVFNAGQFDYAQKMVMDNSGNVHIAGLKGANTGYPTQFYVKYSSSGTFMHQRSITPACQNPNFRGCYAMDITTDNSGNAFICGYVDSAFGYVKGFFVKYNSMGDSVLGVYAGLNDTLQYAMWSSIALDNAGNIYVGGYGLTRNPYTPYYMAAKYNSQGVLQWAKRYRPAQFYDIGYKLSMKLDNTGSIIITSTIQKNMSYSSRDFHVFKLNNAGVFQWGTSYNGPGDDIDEVSDLEIDGSGNAYVLGTASVTASNNEIACVKFNGLNGSQEWSYRTGGTTTFYSDAAKSIALNTSGDIFLTGSLSNSSNDGFLIKLTPAGAEGWRKIISGAGTDDITTDVSVDNAGFIYTLSTINTATSTSVISVRAFSPAGDSLWSTAYDSPATGIKSKDISIRNGSVAVSCETNNTIATDIITLKYSHTTSVQTISSEIPAGFSLGQNYPNPFNPVTNINFSISKPSFVKLTVYDITGKEIAKLVERQFSAGSYNVDFNASALASGTYFYRIEADGFTDIKKMILVK